MSTYADIHETNENLTPCAYCGAVHELDDMTFIGDEWVCETCRDDRFGWCEHCENWVDRDELVSINDGSEYWCNECADNDAYRCDACGDYYTRSGLSYIDGEYSADRSICYGCADSYRQCDDCGAIILVDDCFWDEDDYPHCHDCYQRNHASGIRNYSYKPTPEFAYRGNENHDTTLTFGVELEVDSVDDISCADRQSTARTVTEAAEGRVYCKSDGSLDDGFEIVSHPASLAHHMYQMRWANLMRICKNAGYRSHETDTCGLHIHVGRAQLGDNDQSRSVAVGNLVILSKTLQNELTKFSRRKGENLSRWASFTYLDFAVMDSDAERTEHALGTYRNGRYQAVNLQNRHTVEFRIFRGTLKRDTFIAALQLVSNLCQYAMAHTPSECLTATFADIVAVHPYDELVSYSRNKRLIATELVVSPR